MERDFMGVNSNDPLASVKGEFTDEGPEMLYASSHSHMLFSGQASHHDGLRKMVPDALTSSAFIPSSSPNAFHHGSSISTGEFQNPLLKANFNSYGQNLTATTTTQHFLGIPVTVTSPFDPRNNKKSPAQMTIFYAGTVSVYDGISPDKAEAVMILAGNGSSLASNMNPTQSQSMTVSKDEQEMTGILSAPIIKPEPQRVVGPVPIMTPSAVPQFRKASLARFLEKRKERVMSVAPYNCEK